MNLPDNIKKVFIDGTRSMLNAGHNYTEFQQAEKQYKKAGCETRTSLMANCAITIFEGEVTRAQKIAYQIQQIAECDALVLLKGWELDFNIRIKIAFCTSQGIPILDAYTNRYILAEVDLTPTVEYHTVITQTALTKENLN